MKIPISVLQAYDFKDKISAIKSFGTGLINHTWKLDVENKSYILQRVNMDVFKDPNAIAENIHMIGAFLKKHSPDYLFVSPVKTWKGEEMVFSDDEEGGGYFRLFPFINDSHSKDVLQNPLQAFEAATQFGRFTKLLSGFDVNLLKITIPSFHDLSLRFKQFKKSLENGNKERILQSTSLIEFINQESSIVTEYELIENNPSFKKRVTHHDTKISNVLFNSAEKAICVIDLDTVMSGYFISDVGDMMRTYLPTVSEEESDFTKIEVREDIYHAIVRGYGNEMTTELTHTEKKHFYYAGLFMIYMQALRFLTDHINNDAYYGARYPGHNFVRAGNQVVLLQCLKAKKNILVKI